MLAELSITPLTGDTHISEEIADIVNIIQESDLPYELTPAGTCIEGDWDEVMAVVKRCHDYAREQSPHVITHLKLEDEEGALNKLEENVRSVEAKV